MKEEELIKITGGAIKITATMLNSISRVAQILLELGKTLGSVVRRSITRSYC